MMNGRPAKSHDPRRGPFRGIRTWMGRLLTSRPFLLAISLLVAVLFWGTLVASDGTLTRQKTFSNVPVSVTGEAALQSRGYIVMDNLSELIPTVKMTAEVAQSNYSRVTGASYNPHIDVSQVAGEGENVLFISYTSQLYGPVVSCEPSSVTVNVERYVSRRVPVVLESDGAPPAGFYLDASRTDPTMLTVAGPQSLVTRVARAVARLDVSALDPERLTDRTSLSIELQDASGEAIASDKLQITNQTVITSTVTVETELIPAKEVPVDLPSLVTGEPAEGFELTGIAAASERLTVAAPQEVLDAIASLSTDQPMDISGATQDVTGSVRLRRPTGVENTLPTELTVTARIAERTSERTFRSVPVEIEGLDESLYRASLSQNRLTAQLTGGYGFITGLSASDIRLFVDAQGLGEGAHALPVQIHIDNAPEGFECALSAPELTLTIRSR